MLSISPVTAVTITALAGVTLYALLNDKKIRIDKKNYKVINLNAKTRAYNQKQRSLGAREETWKH